MKKVTTPQVTTGKVEEIAWGERENMIAEYGAFDPLTIGIEAKACRYLVLPIGNGQYDTEWCSTRKDAIELARERAREESDYQERKIPVIVV